ncbi:MAG: glycosyl hydrolase family 59 [bacterium]|nr:glycosyl hydrolase family 59 [bacterium]
MKLRKLLSGICAFAITCASLSMTTNVYGENKMENKKLTKTITIDGTKADQRENNKYRGMGMVSGNNSSRLLLDYKSEHPDAYWEIMKHLFDKDQGMGLSHIKVEMGADINSSSGTEPSVKRSEDEKADVTRGAGYQLAADAKTINKDITLDMLWWSEPAWVTKSKDIYKARYQWYKETLDAAFDTYQLQFDYVSATQNEKTIDPDWIKYLSKHLKEEKDGRYDYSKIKVVAADEVTAWNIVNYIKKDKELLNAIDVLGSHYTSQSSKDAQKLKENNGKELWFSEGSSPMSYAVGTYKYDGTGSGLSDINGMLDIATRIITAESRGCMNLYEFQPAVASYYNGSTYFQKQEITANEPWSGYYEVDAGYYMALQFSLFAKTGWQYVEGASDGDGKPGGDGHAIVDSTYNYLTVTDPDTGDFSTIIANNTGNTIEYTLDASNLKKAGEPVDVWESRGPDKTSKTYYDNFLQKVKTVEATKNGAKNTYVVSVKPYSMATISTLKIERPKISTPDISKSTILSLPYSDDFEYKDYDADYLKNRGYAPRYTTDQSGAFEVSTVDGKQVLEQKITYENKAEEWGGGNGNKPITTLGDDNWANYSVSVDGKLADKNAAGTELNYLGVGARCNLACNGESGFVLKVHEDGTWIFINNGTELKKGKVEGFDKTAWNTLKLVVNDNKVSGYINEKSLVTYEAKFDDEYAINASGRVALYSDFNNNAFDNLKVEPINGICTNSIRVDDTADGITYTGKWTHETMSSFTNYCRTLSSTEQAGAKVSFEVNGQGFAVLGGCTDAVLDIEVDGKKVRTNQKASDWHSRCTSTYVYGLAEGQHSVVITVKSGSFALDAIEVLKNTEFKKQVVVGTADMTSQTLSVKTTGAPENKTVTASNAPEGNKRTNNNSKVIGILIASAAVVIAAVAYIVLRKRRK